MKKICRMFLIVFLTAVFFMPFAVKSNAAFYSKMLSETEAASVLNIISANEGTSAYNKAHYLFYSPTYAAAYNKKFPYLNSNGYVYSVADNGTNYSITGSAGCMAYSNYVCKYVFGTNSTAANRKYICSTAGAMTSDNVKNIIMTEAQMGEQIRINDTHSISFMAYDNSGFYYTSYYVDSNPKIYIAYTTWENFKNECNNRNKTAWIYNTDTSLNNESTITTITHGYSGCSDTITDTNALVYGTVNKPSASTVNQFGIRIRKTNSTYENGWNYYHAPSSNYEGTSTIKIWFNVYEELGITLTHATNYTYQLYAKINGTEYWSTEKTFTTTGSHSYGSWVTTQSPTCTATGTQKRSCVCGATETQTTSALGHNYSSTWTTDVAATCTTVGSKSRHCTRCSAKTDVTTIPTTTHVFDEGTVTLEPTCTAEGVNMLRCFYCGAPCPLSIPALGHNYSSTWTTDTAPTCTSAGSKSHHCTRCSAKTDVTAIAAKGHSYSAWTTTKAPTCTLSGEQKRTCSTCKTVETKGISALGHSYSSSWTTDTAPSCTTAGSKSHHCTKCSAKTDITAITATGHAWNEWKITVNATEESTGTKTRTCKNSGCTVKETAVIAKLPSAGHTHSFGEWYTEKAATCTADGTLKRKCSGCDAFESKTISATGHSFGQWTMSKPATEKAEGILERKCANCTAKETESIPRLPQIVTEAPVTPTPIPAPTEAPTQNVGIPEVTAEPSVTSPILSDAPITTSEATTEATAVPTKLPTSNNPENNDDTGNDSTKIALIAVSSIAILLLVALVVIVLKKKS